MPDSSLYAANGSTGFLLVDVQTVFARVLPQYEELVRRCQFALESAILLELPVYITEQAPDKLGSTQPELTAAAPEAKIFTKTAFSALRAEGLLKTLQGQNLRHLLVGGLETPVCIYQTVMDALGEGFQVTLLSDCLGCRREEDGKAIIDYLGRQKNCHHLPAEAVFYSLLGDAKAPAFRAYTRLVKKFS